MGLSCHVRRKAPMTTFALTNFVTLTAYTMASHKEEGKDSGEHDDLDSLSQHAA